MLTAFDISTSALVAQRTRLNAISSNIANMSTVRDEFGEIKPYQARHVIFQVDENQTDIGAASVKVAEVVTEDVEPRYKYEPGNPMRIKSGRYKDYVAYPQVNMTAEFVNALEATRAYEANVGVIEATKSMGQQTLRILA